MRDKLQVGDDFVHTSVSVQTRISTSAYEAHSITLFTILLFLPDLLFAGTSLRSTTLVGVQMTSI